MGLAPVVVNEIFDLVRRIAFEGEPGELDGEDLFARYLGHAA